jgi:hypothetical protein
MAVTDRTSDRGNDSDAIALLTREHGHINGLFREYQRIKHAPDSDDLKAELVKRICDDLAVHTRIEEEIFYPAARLAIADDDLIDEAEVEHAGTKGLIARLESLWPGEHHYDACVTILGRYFSDHVKEEQDRIFSKVRQSELNLRELGLKMARLRAELASSPEALKGMGDAFVPPPKKIDYGKIGHR